MICLVMIVKDEAHVIRRCLESVRPFVDAWVICDTGSTDETRSIVLDVMGDMPGSLIDHVWVDFATNRNVAMQEARDLFPDAYALTIDADETLIGSLPFELGEQRPHQDAYMLPVEYAGVRYDRIALMRLDRPWRYVGAVHELPVLEGATIGHLSAPLIHVEHDGARSRDPETYRKDAALLESELERNPGDPRAQFYLAQSYRDSGQPILAQEMYEMRARNESGWWQERVVSLLQMGRLCEGRGFNPLPHYLAAYALDPRRAEGLMLAAVYEREHGRPALALLYAREATRITEPTEDVLFSESWAYGRRAWEERGWAANGVGEYAEGNQSLRKAETCS